MKDEMLNMTQEWDKTFPKSDKVDQGGLGTCTR